MDKEMEKVVTEFMDAWSNNDWYEMLIRTQKTWQSKSSSDAKMIFDLFGGQKIESYEIGMGREISSMCYDIIVTINKEKRTVARVIKERSPYTPSVEGEWGINPISMLNPLPFIYEQGIE